MPVDALNEVKVYEQQSDKEQMTGVSDGKKKTLKMCIRDRFRDQYAKEHGWNFIGESNMEAFNAGVGPFTHGLSLIHS